MRKFDARVEDPHFHEIHHALGCPWPDEIMGETYRNYFAVDTESDTARRMRGSPHWSGGSEKSGMAFFHVTEQGKLALMDHMRTSVEIPARWRVTFRNHEGAIFVAARSRSAARYAAYIAADLDWTFMDYAAEIKSVRLHSPATGPR